MRQHIRALDGVRAIACLAVIAHHVGIIPGGWLGVDVFFVLSGYLITSVLLAEVEDRGSIHLGRFYLRRAGRLYPALLVTVVGCWLAGALVERIALAPIDVTATLVYVTDLRPLGTWAAPIAHTWSLAVEEQFYMLWPIVIMALRDRRRVGVAAGVGASLSFAAMLMLTSPSAGTPDAYVYPHIRA